jgi:hypothetical protein
MKEVAPAGMITITHGDNGVEDEASEVRIKISIGRQDFSQLKIRRGKYDKVNIRDLPPFIARLLDAWADTSGMAETMDEWNMDNITLGGRHEKKLHKK